MFFKFSYNIHKGIEIWYSNSYFGLSKNIKLKYSGLKISP
jgi:hypothetical protein